MDTAQTTNAHHHLRDEETTARLLSLAALQQYGGSSGVQAHLVPVLFARKATQSAVAYAAAVGSVPLVSFCGSLPRRKFDVFLPC